MEIQKIDMWIGHYRDVRFEIHRWADKISEMFGREVNWTFYVLVRDNMFTHEVWEKVKPTKKKVDFGRGWIWDYDENPLALLPFHGGCTYFEKVSDAEIYKIGCDYQHYYDEGHDYQLEDIVADVKKVIDTLVEQYMEDTNE